MSQSVAGACAVRSFSRLHAPSSVGSTWFLLAARVLLLSLAVAAGKKCPLLFTNVDMGEGGSQTSAGAERRGWKLSWRLDCFTVITLCEMEEWQRSTNLLYITSQLSSRTKRSGEQKTVRPRWCSRHSGHRHEREPLARTEADKGGDRLSGVVLQGEQTGSLVAAYALVTSAAGRLIVISAAPRLSTTDAPITA